MEKTVIRRLTLSLAAAVLLSMTPGNSFARTGAVVYAAEAEEAESLLEDADSKLDMLEDEAAAVAEAIGSTQEDIDAAITALAELQAAITAKEDEVAQGTLNLAEAKKKAASEYGDMKLRIQYMYENSTMDNLWNAIAGADGLADLLNRVEYVSEMYRSDREKVAEYQAAVENLQATQDKLTEDLAGMLSLRDTYSLKKAALEERLYSLQQEEVDWSEQIYRYEELASQYTEVLKSLGVIVEERETASAERLTAELEENGSSEDLEGDADPEGTTGVSGEELTAYALEFVGNPYMWGGNSLTEGCSAAEFVHQVFAHFGIDTPRFSEDFLAHGQPVSYENLRAGDVVIYAGHVGIYLSDGCIVEEQCESAGITKYRAVDCREIIGIRRYL